MTIRQDLDKQIAMAEASKGSYMLFAVGSEDEKARQVFSDMAADMERHVKILQSRADYLDQYNPLNADGGGDEDEGNGNGKDKDKDKKKKKKEGSK
jgi:rubrerythrin